MPKAANVRGAGELSRKLKQLPKVVDKSSVESIRVETNNIANDLRRLAPRDTGDLAESVQAEVRAKQLRGIAAVTAEHAKFVNFGTTENEAQPFADVAAELSRDRFPGGVKVGLSGALRKLAGR
jgi:HK97 gp10 family phage protein